MTNLYLHNNNFEGAPDIGTNDSMANYRYHDNDLLQSDVDEVVEGIYNNFAHFTDPTPELSIGGSNAEPSGIYHDDTPPNTGKEYIYKIVNDPDGTGNNKWSVTYNGGTP